MGDYYVHMVLKPKGMDFITTIRLWFYINLYFVVTQNEWYEIHCYLKLCGYMAQTSGSGKDTIRVGFISSQMGLMPYHKNGNLGLNKWYYSRRGVIWPANGKGRF